jgi:hypothetical protein
VSPLTLRHLYQSAGLAPTGEAKAKNKTAAIDTKAFMEPSVVFKDKEEMMPRHPADPDFAFASLCNLV